MEQGARKRHSRQEPLTHSMPFYSTPFLDKEWGVSESHHHGSNKIELTNITSPCTPVGTMSEEIHAMPRRCQDKMSDHCRITSWSLLDQGQLNDNQIGGDVMYTCLYQVGKDTCHLETRLTQNVGSQFDLSRVKTKAERETILIERNKIG